MRSHPQVQDNRGWDLLDILLGASDLHIGSDPTGLACLFFINSMHFEYLSNASSTASSVALHSGANIVNQKLGSKHSIFLVNGKNFFSPD